MKLYSKKHNQKYTYSAVLKKKIAIRKNRPPVGKTLFFYHPSYQWNEEKISPMSLCLREQKHDSETLYTFTRIEEGGITRKQKGPGTGNFKTAKGLGTRNFSSEGERRGKKKG